MTTGQLSMGNCAMRFGLLKHITFSTEVLSCKPLPGTEKNWEVKTRNNVTGEEKCYVFDAVLVAVGHHAEPHFPVDEFEGLKTFYGRVLHSHDFRDFHGFENKNVLIIGMGNSGADIAVELSWHAKQVYLSTGSGAWVLHRVGPHGVPIDFVGLTRYQDFLTKLLPKKMIQNVLERMLTAKMDHAHYGLKPTFAPTEQHPLVNDDLPNRIINGSIKIKSNVSGFTGDSALFVDDSEEVVDVVIFATGYKYSFPFLDTSVLEVKRNTECSLYKYMWPPHLDRSSLAVIGHIQALGAVNPVSEMQCRWATRVFKGLAKLPLEAEMMRDIEEKARSMKNDFYSTQRHTLEVKHVDYMDQIAEKIGVKPNLIKLFLTDYKLANKEMGQDGVAKEAKYYLMKRRRKIIRGSMRPSSGTIKYLRMIDELNIYFQVFIYYLRLTQDLEATKAFFKLSSEDLNASNWSKSGKTYFYVINSMMTQHKVTIEDRERTKREKHDDIRATLSRVPSKALPLVARRNCETRQQGAASKHQHIYVAMENHAPCDVERRHNIIELLAGEKVEVLVRSKTGWWFVKRLESCENSYGYVPASFLTEEYSAITSSKRHNENEASSGKRLRAMTSPDVWALKAVKGHPGAASRPDRQAERNDYVTTRAYIAQNDDELSFGEDVILQVIDKKDDGWWLARYKNNEGLVPGIFLKKFNDPIRKLSLEVFNIR
ncbi:flavin-containing monooxygenase 5-like isoform X2 [Clavelina lepadiformis]|uniref:flavin-containing monooxygenase 5-like isoform X2 n=1 Tax=Clavelina lepadiformis TaxID=159417 RepID=UPI004041D659